MSRVRVIDELVNAAGAAARAALLVTIGLQCVRAADTPAPGPVETIVIKGRRVEVQSLIDRKVYHIESDVQASFGSLTDVLSIIPSVDVGVDGAITLRGDANVLILVDGKLATQFRGTAAADALESFPASEVERIEVMSSPPPQYKAQGTAGAINIVTRRGHRQGVNGTLRGSGGSGGRSVAGANASYASGPLAGSISASYRHDVRQRAATSGIVAMDPATGAVTDSSNSLQEIIRRDTPRLMLSGSYAPDRMHSISLDVSGGRRNGPRDFSELLTTSDSAGLTSSTARQSAGHERSSDGDAKLVFSQLFARPNEKLDFTVHRGVSHRLLDYDYTNEPLAPAGPTYYDSLDLREDRGYSEASADYVLPLDPSHIWKLGYAFDRDDFQHGAAGAALDPVTGAPLDLSDNFRFARRTHALYASYQAAGERWTWLTGVRGELVRTDTEQPALATTASTQHLDAYPSVRIDWSVGLKGTLSFGASRRVTQPDPENLNPYVDYEYSPSLRAGNIALVPEFTQSYELGYSYDGTRLSYSMTGYVRRNQDRATDVMQYLGNGATLTTKDNLQRSDSDGVEFTIDGHIFQRLSATLSGNVFYNEIDATTLGAARQRSTSENAKLRLDYRTANDSLQFSVARTGKRLTAQGYITSYTIVNLGYRRQFSRKLTGVVTASDVGAGRHYEHFFITPDFTDDYRRSVRGRIVYAGLIYAFGTTPKDKNKEPGFEYDEE